MELFSTTFLRECFAYNEETGILTWKVRPNHHFKSWKVANQWNGQFAGRDVTYINSNGYTECSINNHPYRAHRIIWQIVYDELPPKMIDHINNVRTDNKITNLRAATNTINAWNRGKSSTNTSGHKGIIWNRWANKWMVAFGNNGRHIHVGYFVDLEDAKKAYIEAIKSLRGDLARID